MALLAQRSRLAAGRRGPLEPRILASALVLFVFLAQAASGREDIAVRAGVGRRLLEEHSAAAAPLGGDGALTPDDLPNQRPAAPTGGFCNYTCASKVTVKTSDSIPGGVLYIDVKYKTPIPGVNSTHMRWLFQNLDGTAQDEAGATWPLFLLFHSRDHMFHRTTLVPGQHQAGVGTNFTSAKMMLSGCSYDPKSAKAPWKCPQDAAGFTRSSPSSEWSTRFQTKDTMTVSSFTPRGIQYNRNEVIGGPGSRRTVSTTMHAWSNADGGLKLRTQLWIGLMAVGKTTTFDPVLGPVAAPTIISTYLGTPLPSNFQNPANMTQVGWGLALHFLEMYGSLGKWLPRVWEAAQNAEG